MAYIHPAAVEHQRKRWTRPDAYRFAPPGTPEAKPPGYLHPWAAVARLEEAAEDEARESAVAEQDAERAWEAECAERKFRADIAWERFKLALVRREFALRSKAGFNPGQPRVPAGNPDSGQWTGEGGSGAQGSSSDDHDRNTGRNDPRILSDATPDNFFKPGAQLAQNETQRRYSVDLNEEEARGGHTLRNHVGRTDDELLASVRGDRGTAGFYRYARKREGSFESRESANDFVNRTLERNQIMVDRVADGKLDREFLNARFGYPTGREAFRPSIDSEPYIRDTYEVGVEIRRDPSSVRGYRVLTAYPRNEDPR